MRRLTIARVACLACLVVAGAPPALAACDVRQSACDQAWTGTPEEFLATERVVTTTAQVLAFAGKPFVGTVESELEGEGGVVQRVFWRGGITRISDRQWSKPTTITYLSATRACIRKVSKQSPNTLQADRTATWHCRPRTQADVDGPQWLASLTPAAELAQRPNPQWYADITAHVPEYAVDSALTIQVHARTPDIGDWVIVPKKMLVDEVAYGVIVEERATTVTAQAVPRLPTIPGLTPEGPALLMQPGIGHDAAPLR